jgi:hypothetical protein
MQENQPRRLYRSLKQSTKRALQPYTNRLFPLKHLFTSIVLPFVCLSFFSLKAKAQEEMYWGTIVRNPRPTMWFGWMTGRY